MHVYATLSPKPYTLNPALWTSGFKAFRASLGDSEHFQFMLGAFRRILGERSAAFEGRAFHGFCASQSLGAFWGPRPATLDPESSWGFQGFGFRV